MIFRGKIEEEPLTNSFHLDAKRLKFEQPHEVLLAKNEISDSLIIFIHGFNGKTTGTWSNFPSLISYNPAFSASDIIFYGYESLRYQASDHAGYFCEFIQKELIANEGSLSKLITDNKLSPRDYVKIHIVAHSLGAIVTREALIRAKNKKYGWVEKTRISLFAPAHLGAKISALIFEACDLFLITKLIYLIADFKIPVISDLKQGSIILKKIKEDTKNLIRDGEGDFLKALFVAHAPGDKVVTNGRFVEDSESDLFEGKTHSSICKPDDGYTIPLKRFAEIIKN